MSLIALAETIDRLVEANRAFIAESESVATVSALSADNASELMQFCSALGWSAELFDRAGDLWPNDASPEIDFEPYRLAIQKPSAPADTLQLLSNQAFAYWLENGHRASYWHIARFIGSLSAGGRVIQSWAGTQHPATMPPTKSPRTLVKEFGNIRRVPEDVRQWLTSALDASSFAQPATQTWVRAASAALISCLPDEVEADTGALKFRGPPRLTLPAFDRVTDTPDQVTFNALLEACSWVFENEREAEMRHILLATELARSGTSSETASIFLSKHLAHAQESAQIAYQMALADTGRDTLKVLSDLRKAVTDETAKLSDISRQLAGSVAAALATGIGLIAARVATNAHAGLIAAVMLVVAAYITLVICSGTQFMRLQRQLRTDWQHRLYRFLPTAEYDRMVAKPTMKAEQSFVWTAWLGGVSVFVLTMACGWTLLFFTPPAPPARPALTSDTTLNAAASRQRETPPIKPPSGPVRRETAPHPPKSTEKDGPKK